MKYPCKKDLQIIVGNNVKKYRKLKGFSQANLCYEIDLDISTLSRLERGKLNVTLNTLYKIGLFLEIPIKDFFDFEID